MAEYRTDIEIAASPATVFEYLVTDAGMSAWMGRAAHLEPVPGGRFAVDIAGSRVRGTFLEVDPPRRVTVSWGFEGDDDVPPGSSTVSFALSETASGTRVELVHTDLPEQAVPGHVEGWTHFVPRLAAAASGLTLPPDTWTPTAP